MSDLGEMEPAAGPVPPPGFVTFTRRQWAGLGRPLRARDTGAGTDREGGEPLPKGEPAEIYRPLCRLLSSVAMARRAETKRVAALLGLSHRQQPFVIGVAGSVAVGKSTVARDISALLGRDPALSPVAVLATDSFLHRNDELAARGLAARKGFPETYDRRKLVATLAAIRAGEEAVEAPVYSHRDYDIVPGRHHVIHRPAALIVEGLNVLQVGPDEQGGSDGSALVSDFLDWSIYVDAAEADIARWHGERLHALRRAGTDESTGFLEWFCSLSDVEAQAVAEHAWSGINAVNLRDHIAPTRLRASMILFKGADHRVSHVLVRAG